MIRRHHEDRESDWIEDRRWCQDRPQRSWPPILMPALGLALMIVGLLLIVVFVMLSAGCAAYDGLIGHPLHVLRDQHKNNEQQKRETQNPKSQSAEINLMPVEVQSIRSAAPGAPQPRTNYMIDFDQAWVRLKSFPDDRWEIWHTTDFAAYSLWTNVPITAKTVTLQNLPQEYFRVRVTNTFTGWTSMWALKSQISNLKSQAP